MCGFYQILYEKLQQSASWKKSFWGGKQGIKVGLSRDWSLAAACRRDGIRRDQKWTSFSVSPRGKRVEAVRLGRRGHIYTWSLCSFFPVVEFCLAWGLCNLIIDFFLLLWTGCQRSIGLSNGKAKVCNYSGWYYCSSCHVDDSFLIPARIVHNWDTAKYKVGTEAGFTS